MKNEREQEEKLRQKKKNIYEQEKRRARERLYQQPLTVSPIITHRSHSPRPCVDRPPQMQSSTSYSGSVNSSDYAAALTRLHFERIQEGIASRPTSSLREITWLEVSVFVLMYKRVTEDISVAIALNSG